MLQKYKNGKFTDNVTRAGWFGLVSDLPEMAED